MSRILYQSLNPRQTLLQPRLQVCGTFFDTMTIFAGNLYTIDLKRVIHSTTLFIKYVKHFNNIGKWPVLENRKRQGEFNGTTISYPWYPYILVVSAYFFRCKQLNERRVVLEFKSRLYSLWGVKAISEWSDLLLCEISSVSSTMPNSVWMIRTNAWHSCCVWRNHVLSYIFVLWMRAGKTITSKCELEMSLQAADKPICRTFWISKLCPSDLYLLRGYAEPEFSPYINDHHGCMIWWTGTATVNCALGSKRTDP